MTMLTKEWETRVRSNYKPRPEKFVTFLTKYNRHPQVNEYLRNYLVTIGHDVNVLLVGAGRCDGAASPTQHIELANLLRNKDYTLTVLDNDTKALHDAVEVDGTLDEATMEYIESKAFIRKRKNGDVSFVLDDIVTADLKRYGPFDIVHCINVLYHIGDAYDLKKWRDEATLALLNIARNMKTGGIMAVDGARTLKKSSNIFSRKLNKNVLGEMQLKQAGRPVYNSEEHITYYFLRKL